MKTKGIFLACIILLLLVSVAAVSASDNATSDSLHLETQQESIEVSQDSNEIAEDGEDAKISDYNYEIYVPEHMNPDEIYTIEVSPMPNDAKGNISISIDDIEQYNQGISLKKNVLIVNDLNLDWGLHNATIKYTGDEKYEGFSKTLPFEYEYLALEVLDENDETIPILINAIKGATGNIKFSIDGKVVLNKKLNSNENPYLIYLDKYPIGQHTYELNYTNGNYKAFTKNGTFNITYPFYIQDFEKNYTIYYSDVQEFEVVLPENSKSNITVTINNRTYIFKSSGEITPIKLSEFNLGENDVTISYEDARYPKQTLKTKVNVLPKLVVPTTVEYKSDAFVRLVMPNTTQGLMTVTINGKTYNTTQLKEGKASIRLSDLSVAEYKLTVSYSGDYNQSENYTITVIPHLEVARKMQRQAGKIVFTAPENFNGKLILSGLVNEIVNVENGSAVITLTNLKTGSNTLFAKYENFTWKIPVDVYEQSPEWNMEVTYPTHIASFDNNYDWYDEDDYIIHVVNAPENITGTFKIYHDGKYVNTVQIDDEYETGFLTIVNPKFNEIKKHTIDICYSGDEYFKQVNKTITYEVANYKFMLFEDGVSVYLPVNAKGKLSVQLDGKSLGKVTVAPNEDREVQSYFFPSQNLKIGSTYKIQIAYSSGNYPSFTKTETQKLDYDIYINTLDEYNYANKNTIRFTLPWDASKKASVKIDGLAQTYKANYNGGTVDISHLKPGEHTIVLTYKDSKYPSKSINATFSIKNEIRTPSDTYFKYLSNNIVSVLLPDDAIGNLTVEINRTGEYEMFKSVSAVNGKANITLPSDKIEKYDYIAYFKGNYEMENKTDSVIVIPTFSAPKTISYGSSKNITIHLDSQNQAKLIVTVFNSEFDIPIVEADINSTNNIVTIDKEIVDKVKSIVEYNVKNFEDYLLPLKSDLYVNGEHYAYLFTNSIKFTPILKTKNIKMLYLDGQKFQVKAYDIFGKLAVKKEITFKIKSKTYTRKTDSKGIATLDIKLIPGIYTITTIFQGLSVKNTIKVNQVLSLKKVKVRKYAKKLVLTASLKKVNGKYLKGKKITFKFNGKTYKATTNKYGIAKVTIKKSVLKKLKVGKKVTYQATYLKTTVKKTAKIAK